MHKSWRLAILTLLLAGCAGQPSPERSEQTGAMFEASAMRIHPVFTQIRDWNGDRRADGIEVMIEFQDVFGDPAKAAGEFVFEVFDFQPGHPDPRGPRVAGPFLASTAAPASQYAHWSRTSRAYAFQLAFENVSPNRPYVLGAIFERTGRDRFMDRLILEPAVPAPLPAVPATNPSR